MKIFLTGGSGTLGSRLLPALLTQGHQVTALVRSQAAARAVATAGAVPLPGDLSDVEALRTGVRGVDAVVHAAARMESGGPPSAYLQDNVEGTKNLLGAAKDAGVTRFVYLGAAMCLLGGRRPIVGADESWPLGQPRYSHYVQSKTLADRAVQAARTDQFATVVLRPAWIWGAAGDPQTAAVLDAIAAGRMRLIDSGRHRIVTSHIDNVIAAIQLALDHPTSRPGYYIFDDGDITSRDFLAELVHAHGQELPTASIPRPVAWATASALDHLWRLLRKPGTPPITRLMVALNGGPFLVSDHLARTELGYHPATSRKTALAHLATATRHGATEQQKQRR